TARLGADHADTLTSQHHLAMLYWSMKKLEQSIPLFEELLKRRKASFDPDHPVTLATQADLGLIYCDAGRFADAIPLLEESHRKHYKAPEGAWVAANALLPVYGRTGKPRKPPALPTDHRGPPPQQVPADSPWLGVRLAEIGKALLDAQAYAAAEPLLRES